MLKWKQKRLPIFVQSSLQCWLFLKGDKTGRYLYIRYTTRVYFFFGNQQLHIIISRYVVVKVLSYWPRKIAICVHTFRVNSQAMVSIRYPFPSKDVTYNYCLDPCCTYIILYYMDSIIKRVICIANSAVPMDYNN